MVIQVTEIVVAKAGADEFYDFMINPNNDRYREWRPEEHLQFYIVKKRDNSHLGETVYYDEYLGENKRLRFFATVEQADRPRSIAWRMKKGKLHLPAVLSIEFTDVTEGLQVSHKLRIGFNGMGRIFDPFIKLYFTKAYATALEKHCREEWLRLAEYLEKENLSVNLTEA